VIELAHVPVAGVVAHTVKDEVKGEVEGGAASPHSTRPYPPVQRGRVTVVVLAGRELVHHGLAREPLVHERDGQGLHVVDPIALNAEASGQPVAGVDQAVSHVVPGDGVDRRELVAKGEVVIDGTRQRIARDEALRRVADEATVLLRKAPVACHAVGAEVLVHAVVAAVALMEHDVGIDIQAVGAHHRDATLERFA
jgi:hypothetical protein